MREADGQHISQVAKSDEGGKTACTSTVAKDIAKEKSSDNDFTLCEIGLWDGSEVGNVGKDV